MDAIQLDGKKIVNLQGEELGDIRQVLLDPQGGQARYAVLQVNKLWQLNDPEIAVPFGALKITGKPTDADFKIQLDSTKDKLTNAPRHKLGEADRLYSKESSAPIYSYWSVIWLDPIPVGSSTTSENKTSDSTSSENKTSDSTTSGNKTSDSTTSDNSASGSAKSGDNRSGSTSGIPEGTDSSTPVNADTQ